MVKSRRAASSFQSSVKATVARRPSVETSRRRVVISNGWPSLTAVTVPWSIPVGMALIFAASRAARPPPRADPGREVDVADGKAEELVADRAADIAGQALVGAERVEQPAHAACACAISPRRASAPLKPARQVDDHRRSRPPDPAPVPHDLVIVALPALEQGALAVLVGRVEQGSERRFEPVGDLMLVGLERKVGRNRPRSPA